jgi:hypothetical protein
MGVVVQICNPSYLEGGGWAQAGGLCYRCLKKENQIRAGMLRNAVIKVKLRIPGKGSCPRKEGMGGKASSLLH